VTEDLAAEVQRVVEASREKRLAATSTALDFSYLVDIDRETGTARMRFDLDRDEQVSRRVGGREAERTDEHAAGKRPCTCRTCWAGGRWRVSSNPKP